MKTKMILIAVCIFLVLSMSACNWTESAKNLGGGVGAGLSSQY